MSAKIVIAYDGSERAADAVALGAGLGRILEATPVVAVVRPSYGHLTAESKLREVTTQDAERLFDSAREIAGETEIETRLVFDDSASRALSELAEELSASAIVVGSARYGMIGRVLLGSVGSSLISGAPCPVAVAPAGYGDEPQHVGTVGVAVDGSVESREALAAAIALAGRSNSRLEVMTVAEPPEFGYAEAFEVITLEQYESAERKHKNQVLKEAVGQIPSGQPLDARLLAGEPGHVLAKASEDLDLLIVGSRGYGPLRRVLLGSVANRLIQKASCPVLVLPRGVGDDPLGLSPKDLGTTSAAA